MNAIEKEIPVAGKSFCGHCMDQPCSCFNDADSDEIIGAKASQRRSEGRIIKIRLSTTNGSELYPEDFILTTRESVTNKDIEDYIEQFKQENEDYQTDDLLNDLIAQYGGTIENATFVPDIDMVI